MILAEQPDMELARQLRMQLTDPHTPAVLRIEIGKLLHQVGELEPDVLMELRRREGISGIDEKAARKDDTRAKSEKR